MVPGERRGQSTVVAFDTMSNRHNDRVLSAPRDSRSERVSARLTFLREREGMRMSSRLPIACAAISVALGAGCRSIPRVPHSEAALAGYWGSGEQAQSP